MKIDINIRRALREHMSANRMSTYDMAAILKVSAPTVSRILDGSTARLNDNTWIRLEPIIRGRLPQQPQPQQSKANEVNEEPEIYGPIRMAPGSLGPALSPVRALATTKQPVIGIAQAAGWVPALQPLGDFLSEFGDSVAWEEVEDGCWLLRVEGISMQPLLANGAILHVDTRRFPKRGEMVVARIASEEFPVVKYYDRRDGIVYLLRLNEEAEQRSYRIDTKSNEDHILWMYPVTEFRSKPPTRLATSEDFS